MSVLLKLHEVVVRRQQREILHGISLSFEPGTVTALVGPNGARCWRWPPETCAPMWAR